MCTFGAVSAVADVAREIANSSAVIGVRFNAELRACWLNCKAATLEQRLDVWVSAAESTIGLGKVTRAADRIDVLEKPTGGFAIKRVVLLLERGKTVGVEHLGPKVAVVTRGVTVACENVKEMRGRVTRHNLLGHPNFRECRCFEL